MGKIQDTADNFIDKIIDHQDKSEDQTEVQTQPSDDTTVLTPPAETKVHNTVSVDEPTRVDEPVKTSAEKSVNEGKDYTHQPAVHIPPQPTKPPHVLKDNPHQNYIYGVGAAIASVLSLFLIPLTLRITPATIIFGLLAILYSRRSERFEGWNASIPKFLGWASMLTGIATFLFSFLVLFVIYVVKMT